MIYVLYHANCYDGFGSAWAVRAHFGADFDGVEYLPVSYGQEPPDMKAGSTVYIVDFSYKRPILMELAKNHRRLVILDHHKTAKEDLEGIEADGPSNIETVFDMDRSGAIITWEYFHPNHAQPRFLQYIQDRDLWEFRLPRSKEFHAWIRSHPFDFELWDRFVQDVEDGLTYPFIEGDAIKRSTDQTVAMMCQKARYAEICGHPAVIVNATCHWSEVGQYLLEQFPAAEFAATYGDVGEGEVQWALRGRGDVDVSEIAKKFGGGGHKNAAGCRGLEYTPLGGGDG